MTQNKNHWYDGWLYDRLIAPHQDKLFGIIKDLIEPGASVIDIGCGTGRLALQLAGKCGFVTGIDLSGRNIRRAKMHLAPGDPANVDYKHEYLSEVIKGQPAAFDYAILTYVIHEVDENDRVALLTDASRAAEKIIIGDYRVPGPGGVAGFISRSVEFITGRDHFKNYRSYMRNGGIYYLAEKAGLKVINEIATNSVTNHILVLSK